VYGDSRPGTGDGPCGIGVSPPGEGDDVFVTIATGAVVTESRPLLLRDSLTGHAHFSKGDVIGKSVFSVDRFGDQVPKWLVSKADPVKEVSQDNRRRICSTYVELGRPSLDAMHQDQLYED
jgi:hypothetical protein